MSTEVTAIILAAGRSSRFGRLKQLEKLGKMTLLERTLDVVKRSRVDRVMIVLGYRAAKILETLNTAGAQVVINHRYASGLSSSLNVGLDAAGEKTDAVLIVLADQPFLSVSIVNRIITGHKRTQLPIVVPTYKGVQGNPVLIEKSLFPELRRLSGDMGAKEVIRRHADKVLRLKLDDLRYLSDIDTEQDLRRIQAFSKRRATRRKTPRNPGEDTSRSTRPS